VTGSARWQVSRASRAAVFALVCVALALVAHVRASGVAPAGWVVAAAVPAVALLALAVVSLARPLSGRHDRSRAAGDVVRLAGARPAQPWPAVAGAMVAFQAVLHAAFCLTAPGEGNHSLLDRVLCQGRRGHHPSAALAERLLALHPGGPGLGSGAPGAHGAFGSFAGSGSGSRGLVALLPAPTPVSLVMLGGHLAAAVAAGWWLHRTDAALSRAAVLVAALRKRWSGTRAASLGVLAAVSGAGSPAVRLVRRRDVPPLAAVRWFRTPVRRGPPAFA
jgi:hypothetical protein